MPSYWKAGRAFTVILIEDKLGISAKVSTGLFGSL